MTPAENMQRLEKAINIADQRIRIRREVNVRVSLTLGAIVAVPLAYYLIYHSMGAHGYVQGWKSSSGAYMNFTQSFLYRPKTQTAIYRPEILMKEQSSSLQLYTRKIEAKRASGELPEGTVHPTAWH